MVIVCIVIALPRAPVAAQPYDSSVQGQIRGELESWQAAFNARRSTEVCGLFAPDLVASYQGQPQRDYSSLCDLLKKSLRDPHRKFHYGLEITEIMTSGDLAVVRLTWTLTIEHEGRAQKVIEPGIDIFRRQTDGSWKISRFLAYPVSQ